MEFGGRGLERKRREREGGVQRHSSFAWWLWPLGKREERCRSRGRRRRRRIVGGGGDGGQKVGANSSQEFHCWWRAEEEEEGSLLSSFSCPT